MAVLPRLGASREKCGFGVRRLIAALGHGDLHPVEKAATSRRNPKVATIAFSRQVVRLCWVFRLHPETHVAGSPRPPLTIGKGTVTIPCGAVTVGFR